MVLESAKRRIRFSPSSDRLVIVVVGAELENLEQLDQSAAVVVGVGGAKHLALVALVGLGARFVLVDEVGQAPHAAGDG